MPLPAAGKFGDISFALFVRFVHDSMPAALLASRYLFTSFTIVCLRRY